MPDPRFSIAYRAVAVAGIGGGGLAVAAFLGLLGGDGTGSVGLLLLGIVLLAVGVPALIAWLKTF